MNIEDCVLVYVAEGKLAAEMIRITLESFGIEVVMAQESLGGTYGFAAGPLGETNILVHKSQLEAAQDVLKAIENGSLEASADDDVEEPSPDSLDEDSEEEASDA
jgi:hypothetical protein